MERENKEGEIIFSGDELSWSINLNEKRMPNNIRNNIYRKRFLY